MALIRNTDTPYNKPVCDKTLYNKTISNIYFSF